MLKVIDEITLMLTFVVGALVLLSHAGWSAALKDRFPGIWRMLHPAHWRVPGVICVVLMCTTLSHFAAFAWIGLYRCESGLDSLWALAASSRSRLVATPLSQRGRLWGVQDWLDSVVLQDPLLTLGHQGRYAEYFIRMQETNRRFSPYKGGVAVHWHSDVKSWLSSTTDITNRNEVPTLTRRAQPSERTRVSLIQALAAARNTSIDTTTPIIYNDGRCEDRDCLIGEIHRGLTGAWWQMVFQEEISDKVATVLVKYLQEPHKLDHKSEAQIVEGAMNTALVAAVEQALSGEGPAAQGTCPQTRLELEDLLSRHVRQRLLSSSDLILSAFKRVSEHPKEYLDLWSQAATSPDETLGFLMETLRLTPTASSVAGVLTETKHADIGAGSKGSLSVSLEQGSPVELVLNTANTDPIVFGGPARSPLEARSFNPRRSTYEFNQVLTWNELTNQIETGSSAVQYLEPASAVVSAVLAKYCARDADALSSHCIKAGQMIHTASKRPVPWYDHVALTDVRTSFLGHSDNDVLNREVHRCPTMM